MKNRVVASLLCSCLLILAIGIAAPSALGQRTSGTLGVGGQIGEPSGITLKLHNADAPSYDFLAAWSLHGDSFFLNGHILFENPISANNLDRPLEWFVGPGGFLELEGEGKFGISGTIGLNLILTDHLSIYGRVTPRLALAPATEEAIGGGLGIRYFF